MGNDIEFDVYFKSKTKKFLKEYLESQSQDILKLATFADLSLSDISPNTIVKDGAKYTFGISGYTRGWEESGEIQDIIFSFEDKCGIDIYYFFRDDFSCYLCIKDSSSDNLYDEMESLEDESLKEELEELIFNDPFGNCERIFQIIANKDYD